MTCPDPAPITMVALVLAFVYMFAGALLWWAGMRQTRERDWS